MKATNRIRIPRRSRRRSIVLRTVVIALCGASLAIGLADSRAEGCGWSGYERSLRFPSGLENKDRLPPLPRDYPVDFPERDGEAFWGYYGEDYCCGGDGISAAAYERVEQLRRQNGDAMT